MRDTLNDMTPGVPGYTRRERERERKREMVRERETYREGIVLNHIVLSTLLKIDI